MLQYYYQATIGSIIKDQIKYRKDRIGKRIVEVDRIGEI